jgi:hypothetical protein
LEACALASKGVVGRPAFSPGTTTVNSAAASTVEQNRRDLVVALLTGLIWVPLYWLIVQKAGGSIWWPTLISFAITFTLRMIALYRGWEEPLAKEPAGVYKHDDGRPLLGRKIAGKSRRELRDLGLLVENGSGQPANVEAPPAAAPAH